MSQQARTILIVDDSPEDRELYRRALRRDDEHTYTLLEAELGQQGLELWQQHQPDVVLLDYRLPDLDGLEFLAQLAPSPQHAYPVIVVTGQGNEAIAVQVMKAGAQDYLIKEQITPEGLQLAINEVIEKVRLRTELHQRIERERLIAQITQQIHTSFDLDHILQTTVNEVRQFLQTDRVIIFRLDSETRGTVITESVGNDWISILSSSMDDPCFIARYLEGYRQGKVTAKTDLNDSTIDPCHKALLNQCQVKANLVVPIVQQGELWGMMIAHHCTAPRQWQPLEIDLLQQLATQVGIALYQTGLYHQLQIELAERKRAEASLRKSQAQLQQQLAEIEAIYQTAPIGLNVLDQDLRFVRINQQSADMNGLPIEAHIGRTVREVLPDLANATDQLLHTVLETGEPLLNVEVQGETPAQPGIKRTWLEHFVPLKQGDRVIGISIVCEEITERKRIEQALRRSEERYRTLFESMNDGFCIIQMLCDEHNTPIDYRFLEVNPMFEEHTGLKDVEGKTAREMLPELESSWIEIYGNVALTGEPIRCEVKSEAMQRWFDVSAFRVGKPEQRKVALLFKDTTARKQVEIALQETTARLNIALKSAPITLFNQDRELRYTWVYNPTLNFFAEDIIGHHDADLEAPDTAVSLTQLKQQVLDTGQSVREEVRITHNGEMGCYDLTIDPIRDETNTVIGIACAAVDVTHHKQTELALRETYIQLEAALAAGAIYIWRYNIPENQVIVDRNFAHMFGVDPENAATGLPMEAFTNAIHPDDRPQVIAAIERAIANGDDLAVEYRIRTNAGKERWVMARGKVDYDANGNAVGFPGALADITKRKQAEIALAANEARLQAFVDASVVGILHGDIYGNIYNANRELMRIIDYPPEDLMSGHLSWIDITPTEYLPLDHQGIAEAKARGACTPYEKEYIRKDGSRVPVLVGYSLMGEAREEAMAFILDLSDRKQAEAALRQSEDRLRIAIESAELGTWDWNPITNEIAWDDRCKAMFGLPPEAEASIELFLLGVHPDDRERIIQGVEQALSPEGIENYEMEFRMIGIEDGIERWIVSKGQVYVNAAGIPQRFIGTVLDITERKHAEAEREHLLERERAAREEAERVNRIKDEFLAILSHELRSPLNPILGWAKLLRTRKFDEAKTAEALATIERNAKLQTQLVDDLLDVAKILRGKLSMNPTPVNPASIIESAIETVRTAALSKSINLHSELPDIGQVMGDMARLQQIVWNLLSNAIKFTPKGGRIDILLEQVDDHAQITVRDTGKGISPTFLPHLFETFRQEDASTTRRYGGLGLGLAIVRHLVEAHGGTISAASEGEGKGATFTVQLPLLSRNPQAGDGQDFTNRYPDLTGVRILTVDDEPDARELLTIALTEYGADVLTVSSAAEVLEEWESFQPDVFISDIGMAGMDGYTLLQRIRALPPEQHGDVPAIAVTAYARGEDQEHALQASFQHHLAKPIDPVKLVEVVSDLTQHNDH